MKARDWHVLGAGAMGCLFSQQLVAAGCRLTLLQRKPPENSTAQILVDCGEEATQTPVTLSGISAPGHIDLLLVATKAPEMAGAVNALQHRLSADTDILLAANGMGFVEQVQALLPNNRLFCCTSTEGAHRLAPLHIRHAGRGITRIGSRDKLPPPPWFGDWLASPLDARWESDINGAMWLKLAINCAINPLTALHRCPNGQLQEIVQLKTQVEALCDEIAAVSIAAGYAETAHCVHSRVAEVIAATAENRSSMLQDVAMGRPTEIEFITGYLVNEADRLGIDAPLNRQLLEQVRALDN